MTEIMEITNQQEYQSAPLWISDEGKVDINSTDIVDQVLLRIIQKLNKYKYWSMIWRWQIHINTVSVDDHKPILVSIGTNHQDTIKTDVIELHKLKYLRDFVIRTDTNVEKLLRANLELFLSECIYSNDRSDPYDVLIETWILDGCFIIELFMKNDEREDSLLFESERILYALNRDLILPNNQMPSVYFIILIKACSLSKKSDQDNDEKLKHFYRLARKFLEGIVPNQKLYQSLDDIDHQFEDLRSIVYDGLKWPLPHQANDNVKVRDDKWNLVQSATELQEFGVEFKMIETDNFVDIKFTNKVLKIPRIRIRYGTPYCIKVLLEYEQSHRQSRYLNNYLWFMNSLVKSPNDVQLLRQKGIIDNLSELPDDAAIHKFLKDLYASLMISPANFNYIQVCRDLNLHCSHRRNVWMAKLKRDYFNSPWTVISVMGASLLLIFTVAQTIFSAASYYKQG
ncbi:uncharacterized protein LOC127810993 [Diospyros lotus]|uniref:uncharacterized protein LOC127810993 n=1 Tax=Diospyros lotus TaxID=55363 RepID=UPI0022541243|nr:uncharacterized protein LOC127810993 [Diospyros lotus]XP_052206607.1 uncharacterized protein LOC127810993 [Diospyros lotus]XP_052206609.1 uncharacterized protein LOC127810993 [Diospyros lotus]